MSPSKTANRKLEHLGDSAAYSRVLGQFASKLVAVVARNILPLETKDIKQRRTLNGPKCLSYAFAVSHQRNVCLPSVLGG